MPYQAQFTQLQAAMNRAESHPPPSVLSTTPVHSTPPSVADGTQHQTQYEELQAVMNRAESHPPPSEVHSTTPSAVDSVQYQAQYEQLQAAMVRAEQLQVAMIRAASELSCHVSGPGVVQAVSAATCGLEASSATRETPVPPVPPSRMLMKYASTATPPEQSELLRSRRPSRTWQSSQSPSRRASFTSSHSATDPAHKTPLRMATQSAAEMANRVLHRKTTRSHLPPTQANVLALERARGAAAGTGVGAVMPLSLHEEEPREARQKKLQTIWTSVLSGTPKVSLIQARFRGRRRRRQHEERIKAWDAKEQKEVLRLLMLEEIFFELDRDAGGYMTADECAPHHQPKLGYWSGPTS
jgi:hypothetical protein